MAVTYPTTLDATVGAGPTGLYATTKTGSSGSGDHGQAHTDISAGIVALETKVGTNGSADVNSHEYKLSHIAYSSLTGIPSSFTPSTHATTHQSGGSDVLALDTLASPSDIVTLNASTSAHGLLRKLSGTASQYLDGSGTWSTPPGANYTASQSIALAANNFTLVNDVAAPGNNQLYGTGGTGTRAWLAVSSLSLVYSQLTSIPAYVPQSAGTTAQVWEGGGGGWVAISGLAVAYSSLTGVPASFTPSAHAATHKSGGADLIALDTLGATTDITTLNSSSTAHGLLPKLSNVVTQFLNGTGGWTVPVDTNTTYTGSQSVLLTTTNFTLLNDVATPTNGQFYGYSGGARGWFTPVDTNTTYTGSQSITLTATNFTLTGDVASPTATQYYGTNAASARGWYSVSGLSIAYSQLTGIPTYVPSSAGTAAQVWSGTPGWVAISGLAVAYASLTGIPTYVPTTAGSSGQYWGGGGAGWATPPNTTYTASQSVTLTATNFTLTGDVAAPGNSYVYGTNAAGTRGWLTQSGLAVAYSSLTGVPASFTPSAHASTHNHGGSDLVTPTYSDLLSIPAYVPSSAGTTAQVWTGGGTGWAAPAAFNGGTISTALTIKYAPPAEPLVATNSMLVLDNLASGNNPPCMSFNYRGATTAAINYYLDSNGLHAVNKQGTDVIVADPSGNPMPYWAYLQNVPAYVPGSAGTSTQAWFGGGTGWAVPPMNTGPAGKNAFSTTTAGFTVPAVGATTTVTFADTSWLAVGEMVYVAGAGDSGTLAGALQVTNIAGNTVTLLNPAVGGITDAPTDGNVYVRSNAAWTDIRPTIYYARQRNINSLGNPNFEVDQVNGHALVTGVANNARLADRWFLKKTGTMTVNSQSIQSNVDIPGTSYRITSYPLQVTLTGQQASLGADDCLYINQVIEGPGWRRMADDVHSVSIIAQCTSPMSFSFSVNENGGYAYQKLCTISTANTWTFFQVPNIAKFLGFYGDIRPSWQGYTFRITLAAGANYVASSDALWVSNSAHDKLASPGTTNFANLPVNTVFSLAFVQHEPGANCGALVDIDYADNLHKCERYYWVSNGRQCFHSISINTIDGFAYFGQHMAYPGSGGSQLLGTVISPIDGTVGKVYDHNDGTQPTGVTVNGMSDDSIWGLTAPNNITAAGHLILTRFIADSQW